MERTHFLSSLTSSAKPVKASSSGEPIWESLSGVLVGKMISPERRSKLSSFYYDVDEDPASSDEQETAEAKNSDTKSETLRVIGNVPIARYEGSPRRLVPRSSSSRFPTTSGWSAGNLPSDSMKRSTSYPPAFETVIDDRGESCSNRDEPEQRQQPPPPPPLYSSHHRQRVPGFPKRVTETSTTETDPSSATDLLLCLSGEEEAQVKTSPIKPSVPSSSKAIDCRNVLEEFFGSSYHSQHLPSDSYEKEGGFLLPTCRSSRLSSACGDDDERSSTQERSEWSSKKSSIIPISSCVDDDLDELDGQPSPQARRQRPRDKDTLVMQLSTSAGDEKSVSLHGGESKGELPVLADGLSSGEDDEEQSSEKEDETKVLESSNHENGDDLSPTREAIRRQLNALELGMADSSSRKQRSYPCYDFRDRDEREENLFICEVGDAVEESSDRDRDSSHSSSSPHKQEQVLIPGLPEPNLVISSLPSRRLAPSSSRDVFATSPSESVAPVEHRLWDYSDQFERVGKRSTKISEDRRDEENQWSPTQKQEFHHASPFAGLKEGRLTPPRASLTRHRRGGSPSSHHRRHFPHASPLHPEEDRHSCSPPPPAPESVRSTPWSCSHVDNDPQHRMIGDSKERRGSLPHSHSSSSSGGPERISEASSRTSSTGSSVSIDQAVREYRETLLQRKRELDHQMQTARGGGSDDEEADRPPHAAGASYIVKKEVEEEDLDTDQETDRLLGEQRSSPPTQTSQSPPQNGSAPRDGGGGSATGGPKKRGKSKEALIEGVLFRARYLGTTELVCEGQQPTKTTRMMQAEEAVSRIKAPDGETQPSTEVDLFISTEKIMVLNTDLKEIMIDHGLRSISYVADIGDLLVLMARRRRPPTESGIAKIPKMISHVFESEEATFIAQSIGQAFQAAYMEFLKANGIEDTFIRDLDYQEVLNSQEIFNDELTMFAEKDHQKDVIVPKAKGEILGIVIVESGWGSMVPTVVIANLLPSGPAARCGSVNIGDQIIAINGISLVGLPLSQCQTCIKNTKHQTAVKMTLVPCAPVVEVMIKRPDTKYQLGFSVQNGVICSLLRGGIAERGGVRVGHRIIEINHQSVVAVPHEKIVNLLATSVGEISMKTMPTSMFRLLTGQETPVYI
ncbi:unnamed protein product [Cyprideis torosa]|uniref:Uncharacterized protein n=1 Tax=Cyprideis torosa TaxID=163714 RepID=A0A7R8WC97_9CRUS|nr:unnamed protein product [Cyprideis torosa]CAG0887769.1 unnamed protein product [Cyprideis torosa]